MNDITAKRLSALQRSTMNLLSAANPSQREAHRRFLIERAQPLNEEQQKIAAWLDNADMWLNENMPGISADETHERNVKWLQRLADYEAISSALNEAWAAVMPEQEANAA